MLLFLNVGIQKTGINPLASELNSWCNLQNPPFKLWDLTFFIQTPQIKREKKKKIQHGCIRMAIND
jgi:hypothetical protein